MFSTQALSVIRRRGQFALLRVLGMERGTLLRQVLLEGASLGVVGAALGIAGGYAMAAVALRFFGGDLGAGYFAGVQPQVQFTPVAAFVYFALGLGVALLGCAAPALEAARAAPAIALKSGSEEVVTTRLAKTWPALACLLLAGALTLLPPVFELPLFGYLSIALLLIGAIALMPQLAAVVFRLLQRAWLRTDASQHAPVRSLTLARLANASGQAGIALGGVLSSFSLMVAMAIMVSSFRVSVDDWLLQILPADVYTRPAASGGTAGLNPREQASIAALPEVARVDFQRLRSLSLAPDRPNVMLLARPINLQAPGKSMVLVGETLPVPAGARPVWLSEAAADLYNVKPGQQIALPLAGGLHQFFVAGIWRDYARSSGAIQMPLDDYRALTGDHDVSDAALWLAKDATGEQLQEKLKALPFGASLEVSNPSAIRALSLQIFDRSFAVTYLLEAIAIVIGLFGVAATFSAQTLARAREFGMLRHVGVTRGQILAVLALEGGALTALGIATGFCSGPVDQLCAGLHRQSAIVPLDHAAAPAVVLDRHRRRRPADGGRPHGPHRGAPGAVRWPHPRRQGGLVMRRLTCLLLLCSAAAIAAPPAFAPVTPLPAGQTLRLPHDFGAHPAYKTEWWYATGWVKTAGGEQLGYQVTFFRSATAADAD